MEFELTISGAIPLQDGLLEALRHAEDDTPDETGELAPDTGEE